MFVSRLLVFIANYANLKPRNCVTNNITTGYYINIRLMEQTKRKISFSEGLWRCASAQPRYWLLLLNWADGAAKLKISFRKKAMPRPI